MAGLDVTALFEARGDAHYGEAVTQRDHALQCATLAARAGGEDELVRAAVLHDLAHLVMLERLGTAVRSHAPVCAEAMRAFVPHRRVLVIALPVSATGY